MGAAAEIRPGSDGRWSIFENGELRAYYPPGAVRLSVVWKAEVLLDEQRVGSAGSLSPERIIEIIQSDLHRKGVAMDLPTDPLNNTEWGALAYRTYTPAARAAAPREYG
jgi:hypothetical protein